MLRQDIERQNESLFRLLENRTDPHLLAEWQKNFRLLLEQAVMFEPGRTVLPKASGPSVKCEYEMRVVTVPRDGRKPNHTHDE